MVRVKRRYFVLHVKYWTKEVHHINIEMFKTSLLQSVEKMYGEFGLALLSSDLHVKRHNSETGCLYLRVARSASQTIASVLPLVTEIGGDEVTLTMLNVSATLRHAKIKHLNLFKQLDQNNSQDSKRKRKLDTDQKIKLKRKQRV